MRTNLSYTGPSNFSISAAENNSRVTMCPLRSNSRRVAASRCGTRVRSGNPSEDFTSALASPVGTTSGGGGDGVTAKPSFATSRLASESLSSALGRATRCRLVDCVARSTFGNVVDTQPSELSNLPRARVRKTFFLHVLLPAICFIKEARYISSL